MIRLGSLGRPILRHVYVCPGADVDEYSYASLYIPNLPFSVEAFTPLALYSSSVDRGYVHQADKSNNQSFYLFLSPLLNISRILVV